MQQRFGIAHRIIHRMVRVNRFPEMLEILPAVLDQTFVQRAEVGRPESEGV